MYPKLTLWVKFGFKRSDREKPRNVGNLERVSKSVAWKGEGKYLYRVSHHHVQCHGWDGLLPKSEESFVERDT